MPGTDGVPPLIRQFVRPIMKSSSECYRLSFYSGYSQFYFVDRDVQGDTGSHDFWTDEAQERGLAVEDGCMV